MGETVDPQLRLALIGDHYRHPRNAGALPDADVTMPGGNPGCGDVVVIYLKVDGERLAEVRFEGRGCTVSQAGTSMLLEDVRSRDLTLAEILELDHHHMETLLGADVVKARPRCATLGLATLKGAVRAHLRRRQAQAAGVEVPAALPEEARGLVLGEGAWEAARDGRPHDWEPGGGEGAGPAGSARAGQS